VFDAIVRHGILVTVVVLILSVLGVLAALRIPVQMIPDLEVRTITVQTRWAGATPQDIEKEILIEQEQYLRNLPNLRRITATSSSGEAEIELEFPFEVDITETLIRVNNALSQVPSYPENVDEPRIYAASFSANSFMFFRVAPLPGNPRRLDMVTMRDFIEDNVATRMASVADISEARAGGGAERQIQILVDPARLAERAVTLADVRSAINERNRDVSAGEIESGKRRYLLRTVGRFDDLEALEDLILARRGDSLIRLGDVAKVQLDHFEIREQSSINGEPVISINLRREPGSNVIDIKREMMAEVERINEDVLRPAGMELAWTSDDVRYVEASVANVWQNLIIGACLATAVMFVFLRSVRLTAVGVIGIPICTIAAFLGLLIAGRTVNVISLAGIAFAIGMTLDNSIVVLSSIELERRRGLDRFAAAVAGVKRVWPAVLASTLTTMLVFVPVVFVAEEAGQLYSDVAIAVAASILMSMLVAITVIPTASARLRDDGAHLKPTESRRLHARVLGGVQWLLATRRRRVACIALTVTASLAVIVGLTPPAEYLPEGEEPKTFASMNAPPGYNLPVMSEIAKEIEAHFLPQVDASPEAFDDGLTSVPPLTYVNMRVEPQRIRIIAEPVDAAHMEPLMDELTRKYEEYPGMRAFVSRGSIITSNDGGTRSINVDIAGPRLEPIYEVASAIYARAQEVFVDPRIQSDPSTLALAQPLIEVRPRWERAAELGLSAQDVGFAVAALTDGAFVDEFILEDDKIDMYLYSDAGTEATLDRMDELLMYTPVGAVVPLSSVADIVETMDTSTVRRVNGRRTVTLNVIPPREVALESGVELMRRDVIEHLRSLGQIPADVSVDISGAADQLATTRAALSSNYAVALVIIFLLLVAIFSHWGYPLLIMTAIPLGISCGIVGLWLLNAIGGLLPLAGLAPVTQSFDMISMLGFLILMGAVVNNPILIVHRAIENVREQGMAVVGAVTEAVDARMRPIAMSTITTVCGLLPLVVLPGAGTELYRGVGVIVLFGIMGAALVSLTMLPSLLVLVLEWRQRATAGAGVSPDDVMSIPPFADGEKATDAETARRRA